MRKDILEHVKELQKDDVEINFAEIARKFNCDYRTVKKYFISPEQETKRSPRPSKLDPYKTIIEDKVGKGCKASSIYRFISKRGFTGKYSIVKEYCRKFKKEQEHKATIRFETNPGLQAQVDWKEDMTLHTKEGEAIRFNIFLILLGFSRFKYLELTFDRTQETLMSAMVNAFRSFKGVPHEIIFDNMKTVVDRSKTKYSQAVINEKFYQFSKDMGFNIWTCRAYRPQTKGKVEALARTVELLRPYDYEFESIEELKQIVKELMNDLNTNVSQATDAVPAELLRKEKEYLYPQPTDDIVETYLTKPLKRKVSRESMITYCEQKYSLPTHYIGKYVEIKVENDKLLIFDNEKKICEHQISNHKYNYTKEHVVEILKSDAMKDCELKTIEEVAKQNVLNYDLLGD